MTRRRRKLTLSRICGWCGGGFLSCASDVRSGRGKFCSPDCANISRRKTRSIRLIEDNSIPEPNSGCWLWLAGITGAGYGAIRVDGRNELAHRLSYNLAYGHFPNNQPVIRHICNLRCCVNPDHLIAGTQQDNCQDSVRSGTKVKGSQHPLAKLSESNVPEIMAALAAGIPQRTIAERYGVSQRAILLVKNGITWRHARDIP